MSYLATVLNKRWLTHDVFQLSIEKPESFTYQIGQAVEISLHKGTDFLKAPFTITSIYEKDVDLQFIIKVYPVHKGITVELAQLKALDTVLISKAWDSFSYNGPGVFIAAGSGITPFIPKLRLLKEQSKVDKHQLIFANKTAKDIILYDELQDILGDQFHNILSKDQLSKHTFGRINEEYLSHIITYYDQYFYLCGPKAFLDSVSADLIMLGVKKKLIQTVY